MVKFVEMPKTHTNHTYRDFTNMPIDATYIIPASIDEMNFHEKLYHLLAYTNIHAPHYMSWCCNGRAFQIVQGAQLEASGTLQCYFGYNTLQRLRKALNTYGYKKLTKDPYAKDRYYSEFLLRDIPHLLQYTIRTKKRRKLLPDASNEPNFDQISLLFPLPCDRRALVMEARLRLQARGFLVFDHVYEFVANQPPPSMSTMPPPPWPGYPPP